jgi:diacylglycerol O-acyltransferase / wax synthase
MASVKQLNPTDLLFVAGENGQIYHHTAGLVVLDTSELRRFDFDYFRDRVIKRVEQVPHFRWKLHEVLFSLDRPYWVEDENFSWDHHFKRAALPSPGDREALAEVAGHIYARHLDRSKPLWEMWYIEGLEDGKVAIIQKTHHCLIDGQGMQKLSELLSDFSPRAKPKPISPDIANARPGATPDLRQQTTNAIAHWTRFPLALGSGLAGTMAPGLVKRLTGKSGESTPKPAVPKVFFNDHISADRGVVFRSVSLTDIKKVKNAFDATVNDVVLALVSSSLRACLLNRGELPDDSLRGGIAVSLRSEDDEDFSNKVTNTSVTLATDLADPLERLRAISAEAEKVKNKARHGGVGIIEIMQALPPILLHGMVNSLGPDQAVDMVGANLVISNVRGSSRPMYIAGARLECMYPISILTSGMGLNITCVSYCDSVDFGFSLAPELFDKPWELVDGLEAALQEYLALIPTS